MVIDIKKITTKLREKIKKHFQEVIATKTSSHHIALGFAIGTFIAILPTPGFNLILCFLITLVFKKVNKYSLFLAILVWNPIVQLPIYYLNYSLGEMIFRSADVITVDVTLANAIYHYTRRYIVGSAITATFLAITSYFAAYFVSKHYKIGKLITKIPKIK